METRIESKGKLYLAGMSFYGDPFGKASAWDEENEIGSLWKRFMADLTAEPEAIPLRADRSERWYEAHLMGPEMLRAGRYEIFVGVEVLSADALSGLPPRFSAKCLPASDYAVITLRGAEIRDDWESKLGSELIPGLGRTADGSICVELYDSRFKGMDRISESELEVWTPLLPTGRA